jgi:ADP-ribose pyrophosphatase YjhB (NUDIX family)
VKKRKPLVIVCSGILIKQGRVLLIQETKPDDPGKYNFPGGTLEMNESILQGLVREFKEETGLRVKPVGLIGVYEKIKARFGNHIIVVVFQVSPVGGRLRVSREHPNVKFYSRQEFLQMKRSGQLRFASILPKALTIAFSRTTIRPIPISLY